MPKPDEKEKQPEEKQPKSEVTETEDGGVVVSVEDDEEKGQVVIDEEEKKDKEPDKKPQPKKEGGRGYTNKIFAHDRILEKIQRDVEEMKKQPSGVFGKVDPGKELDEADKLAQSGDWKGAVRIVSALETKKIIEAQKKEADKVAEAEEIKVQMDNNVEKVMSIWPEVGDPASEVSQIFQRILSKNPRWKHSPDGPLLTLNETERELRRLGYDVDSRYAGGEKVKSGTEKKNEKVPDASLPPSNQVSSQSKVVLTKEQRDFCDAHGVSYTEYASSLKRSSGVEGVEV